MTNPGTTSPRTNIMVVLSVLYGLLVALLAFVGSDAVGIVAGIGGVLIGLVLGHRITVT